MDIFVHLLDRDSREFKQSCSTHFSTRLPTVGEFIIIPDNGHHYEVKLILHTPNSSQYAAELYAVEVDYAVIEAQINGLVAAFT